MSDTPDDACTCCDGGRHVRRNAPELVAVDALGALARIVRELRDGKPARRSDHDWLDARTGT